MPRKRVTLRHELFVELGLRQVGGAVENNCEPGLRQPYYRVHRSVPWTRQSISKGGIPDKTAPSLVATISALPFYPTFSRMRMPVAACPPSRLR